MPQTVLVIGATSGIARACVRAWARQGANLLLTSRDGDEGERVSADARIRGATSAQALRCDPTNLNGHLELSRQLQAQASAGIDVILIAYGSMADQHQAESDPQVAQEQILVNYTSVVLLCEALIAHLTPTGVLAVISSVAGDRGRQSNYLYGSTKAGLTAYLQGLRNRLFHRGQHVLTVKPGFVATPMTAGFLKAGSPLVAQPDQVARDILAAVASRKNTLYTRWFWRWIMLIITSIPESIFKRLLL